MEFKAVRAAFNWLIAKKDGRNEFNCWSAILDFEQQRLSSDAEGLPASKALARADALCLKWRESGDPPSDEARRALEQFTDNEADDALAAVNAYCHHVEPPFRVVPHIVHGL